MGQWFSRPVFFVANIDQALDFYVGKLGFTLNMRHVEDGKALVGGVERDGCEVLLSCQWPDKVGNGMMFISLTSADYADLFNELAARGVVTKQGWWGYRVLIIADPDGNELYFPDPDDKGGGA